MAWRLTQSVIRGEIDNRVRDRITGRIWLVGLAEPLELHLSGNAWRDLAGRRLELTNPAPVAGNLGGIALRQVGLIGDCTASRKVRVPEPDIPLNGIGVDAGGMTPWTWHWANSLYLEWFSERNGRMVIESTTFQLTVSPEPAWEMTAEEERDQRQGAAGATAAFMNQSGEAVTPDEIGRAGGLVRSGETTPAERGTKPLTEHDRLLDEIHARLQRDGTGANLATILEGELARRKKERGDEPPTPEDRVLQDRWMEELNRGAANSVEKWERFLVADLWGQAHPLVDRTHALALRFPLEPAQHPGASEARDPAAPRTQLSVAIAKAAAKLSTALNGGAWPPPAGLAASTMGRLKQARGYLTEAAQAAESWAQQTPGEPLASEAVQRELDALLQECDVIIAELRGRLEQGFH